MVNREESKLKEVRNAFANAILTLNQVRAREILDKTECSVYEFFDKIVAPVMDGIGEGWVRGRFPWLKSICVGGFAKKLPSSI